jgi:hypothetical protein
MIRKITEVNFPSYATLSNANPQLNDMGEKTISTTVKIDGQITPDFSYDWEVQFQGERYIHPLRMPAASKDNSSLMSKVELTFQHWAIYQLKRYYFFQYTTLLSGVVLPDKYEASVILNLKDFVAYVGQVLNYYFGDAITIVLNPNWTYDTEASTVEISYAYIWDVIQELYDTYAVRWTIEANGDPNRYIIRVGYDASELDHIFEYGFEGGLLKVERQIQSDDIRNVLFGRGVETNIPARYFKDVDEDNDTFAADPDWIPELANVYFSELRSSEFRDYVKGWKTNPKRQLTDADGKPITPYPHDKTVSAITVEKYDADYAKTHFAYEMGHTADKFDPVDYVKDDDSIKKYGELVGSVEADEDTYPTIQRVNSAEHTDYFPDDIGRIDEVVDVEEVLTDDYEAATATDVNVQTGTATYTTIKIPFEESGTFEARSAQFVVPEGQKANLEVSPQILSATIYQNKTPWLKDESRAVYKELYTGVDAMAMVEMDESSVNVVDVSTGNKLNQTIALPAGTYYYIITGTIRYTGKEEHTYAKVTVGCESATITSAVVTTESLYKQTFNVWIKNIFNTTQADGESDEDYAKRVWQPLIGTADESEAVVCFSDGLLSTSEDYEFKIVDYPTLDTSKSIKITKANGRSINVRSHWCLKLSKSDADFDALGIYIPSTTRNAVAGNHFYFNSMELPHDYVLWAEEDVHNNKLNALDELKDIKPTWVVSLDKVRLNQVEEGSSAYLALENLGLVLLENNGKIRLETDSVETLLDKLKVGMSLRLADKRFILNEDGTPAAYDTLYIQSISYTYSEPSGNTSNILPNVEITLATEYEVTANPVETISADVSALASKVGNLSNVEQIVRLVGDKLYLRKDGIADRSVSPTAFSNLVSALNFRQGAIGGYGWGFYKDDNGNWVIEADKAVLRQELQVNSLVVNQIVGRGGMIVETVATMEITRVDSDDEGYRCYFDQKNGTVWNMFRVDDVAYCNRFRDSEDENGNITYAENKFYKRRVIGIGVDYVLLSKEDTNGDGEPEEGDTIVQYGNYTDKTRQYAIIRDAQGGGYERFLEGLDSVDADGTEYYFVGRQAGMYNGNPRFYLGNEKGYIQFEDGILRIKGRIAINSTIGDTDKTLDDYVTDTTKSVYQQQIEDLQNQIDGVVQSWNGTVEPTVDNYPASDWTTPEERAAHNGDSYLNIGDYDENTNPYAGGSWKWYYNSEDDYGWVRITDSDAARALQLALLSIVDTDVLYVQTASSTDAPALPTDSNTNGWSTDAPDWAENKYIWTTTKVTNGAGAVSYSDPVCISGKDGRGISSIVEEYYLSSSATTLLGGSWSTTRQTWVAGKYYWTRSKITYTDGTSVYTTAVCVSGASGVSVLAQFSVDGQSNWHSTYNSEDQYMRISTDSGATWSEVIQLFVTGEDGSYQVFQWAQGTETEVTGEWQDSPFTVDAGFYLWMRMGTVTPPSTEPVWSPAFRLTGDSGTNGSDVFLLDLSNEVATVACDKDGNVTGTLPTSKVAVYKGGTDETTAWTISISASGCTATYTKSTHTITVKTLTKDDATVTVTATSSGEGRPTLTAVMSITKAKAGQDGEDAVMYEIIPSVDSVSKDFNGNLSDASITCEVFKIVGATRDHTDEQTLKAQRMGVDSEMATLSVTDGVSEAVGITKATTAVIFALYDADGKVLDRERVPVLSDTTGVDGYIDNSIADTIPYTLVISNEMGAIPCDSEGVPQSGWEITSQLTVYRGNEKRNDWSFTASAGDYTTDISTDNVLSVTAVKNDAPDVMQITITATQAKTGDILTGLITLYKVKAGAEGAKAVMYQIIPSVDHVIRNIVDGSGTAVKVGCAVYQIVGNMRSTSNYGTLKVQRKGWDSSQVRASRTNGVYSGIELITSDGTINSLITSVEFTLYDTDGSTVLDRQNVPILSDASELEIEPNNLALGTAFPKKFTSFQNANNECRNLYYLTPSLKSGNKFRISFDYDINVSYDASQSGKIRVYLTDGSTVWMSLFETTATETTGHFESGVLTVPDGITSDMELYTYVRLDYVSGGLLGISYMMLQKGTVLSDWAVSPHDTDYLTQAVLDNTAIDGGLLLTSVIKVGTQTDADTMEQVTTAGLNGVRDESEGAGGGIAFWAGGDAVDAALNTDSSVQSATTVIRHDGSAYFSGNTLRLAQNVVEVGDNVILDKDGLALYNTDGSQRLRIANTSVGSDVDFTNTNASISKTGTTDSSVALVQRSRVTAVGTPGVDGLPGTLEQVTDYWWVAKDNYTATINLGTVNKGSDIRLGELVVKITGLDYRLEGTCSFRVGYYDSSGSKVYLSNYTTSTSFASTTSGTVTAKATVSIYVAGSEVTVRGTYFVEFTINKGSYVSSSTNTTKTVSTSNVAVSAEGSIQQSYSQRTLLGSDGLISVWGGVGLLINSTHIVMRYGSAVGLRISAAGIQKLSNNSWVAASL